MPRTISFERALPSGTAPPARSESSSAVRLLVVGRDPPSAAVGSVRGPVEVRMAPDLHGADRGSRPCPILRSLLPVLLREPPSSNEFTLRPYDIPSHMRSYPYAV